MKKIMTFFTMLILNCSAFAMPTEADRASLFMVTEVAQSCAAEFSLALDKGQTILRLTSEHSKNAEGLNISTLIMTTGYARSPSNPGETIRNVITLVKTYKAVQPHGHYGVFYDVTSGLNK